VKRHIVVEAVARELLEALGVFRREIGAERNHDAALARVDHKRIVLVEVGRQGLRQRRCGKHQYGQESKQTDHGVSAWDGGMMTPGYDRRS